MTYEYIHTYIHTYLLFLLSWAYSACVLFALLFQRHGTLSRSICVSLSGSSVVCGVLRGSLQEHNCAISTTPEASFRELPYQLPLRFTLGTWLWEIQVYFQIFHNATIVIQQIRMYLWYDIRIHTYIHTYIHADTACV